MISVMAFPCSYPVIYVRLFGIGKFKSRTRSTSFVLNLIPDFYDIVKLESSVGKLEKLGSAGQFEVGKF